MPASARSADVLYFVCGGCGSELSVPVALHGVTGPCPCCARTIRAPELYVPPAVVAVSLPPVDRRHETWQNTESIPVPEWMNTEAGSPPELVPALQECTLEDNMEETLLDLLPAKERQRLITVDHFPEGRGGADTGGFQAKLTISSPTEPLDDSWRERHRANRDRIAKVKSMDRMAERVISSPAFRMARVALLVIIGGLCAALVLFLKDRHWVMDLPWRPDRADHTVELLPPAPGPVPVLAPGPQDAVESADRSNPFLAEDPFGLELVTPPAVDLPRPDSAAITGGTPPIASGKK